MQEHTTQEQELEAIGHLLDVSLEYGLEIEVIYSALKYMKENSHATPVEAFTMGVTAWVK